MITPADSPFHLEQLSEVCSVIGSFLLTGVWMTIDALALLIILPVVIPVLAVKALCDIPCEQWGISFLYDHAAVDFGKVCNYLPVTFFFRCTQGKFPIEDI